jgi:hypothetical protein
MIFISWAFYVFGMPGWCWKHITKGRRDSNISLYFPLENDMSEPTFTLFLLIVLLYLVKS